MRCEAKLKHIDFTIIGDPNNQYEANNVQHFIDHAGLIPEFFDLENTDPLFVQAVDNYPFYYGDMEGSTIDEGDLSMSYPGDPDMYPLIIFKRGDDNLIVYNYSIVAGIYFENGEKITRVTRMD